MVVVVGWLSMGSCSWGWKGGGCIIEGKFVG